MSLAPHRMGSVRHGGGLALLIGVLLVTGLSAAVLPLPQSALAATATASGDLTVFAGPGEAYDPLTYAPAGAVLSVDGDPIDGFYPVTFDGVSGWAATWLVAVDGATAPVVETVLDPVVEEVAPVVEETAPVVEETAPVVAELAPVDTVASPPAGTASSEEEIIQIIYAAADAYDQPRDDMLRVARCESNLDPNAINAGGDTHGLFQFLPSTFASTPYAEHSIYDPWANANAAGWMWSQGRRNEWVCQ